jgi:hypothetical protein
MQGVKENGRVAALIAPSSKQEASKPDDAAPAAATSTPVQGKGQSKGKQ